MAISRRSFLKELLAAGTVATISGVMAQDKKKEEKLWQVQLLK